jgi:hypothetical protein
MKFSEVELPSNQKFGYFFTAMFGVAGLYFIYENIIIVAYAFFGLTGLLLIVVLTKPELILPLNKLWMRLGLLLGMIISPIVLGIIFFGIFTPIALFMRISGRDELRLRLKERQSFWKLKEVNTTLVDAFKYQF